MIAKKRVRALLCLCSSLLLSGFYASSQPLSVGDPLPASLWETPLSVVNHPSETLTLSRFKDRLLILDFWATWCGPCIGMLPRQDSLQKQFAAELQILPVTYESGSVVSAFMEKYARRKGLSFQEPEVVSDTLLSRFFPHSTVPHYVWIKDGVVQAITGHQEVNTEKITAMLSQQVVTLKTKSQTAPLGYAPNRVSLAEFVARNHPDLLAEFGYRSLLSGYIPGLASQVKVVRPVDESSSWRFTFTNVPLLRLFQFAYGQGASFTNLSSILIETPDSARVMQPRSVTDFMEWNLQHAWCYELQLPASVSGDGFAFLRRQLSLLFPDFQVVVENRLMPVLSLERDPDTPLSVSPSASFRESYDGFTYEFTGTAAQFVRGLNGIYLGGISETVVDKTGSDQTLDLSLQANMSQVTDLDRALRAHGLRLNKTTATIPVLVIKDAP